MSQCDKHRQQNTAARAGRALPVLQVLCQRMPTPASRRPRGAAAEHSHGTKLSRKTRFLLAMTSVSIILTETTVTVKHLQIKVVSSSNEKTKPTPTPVFILKVCFLHRRLEVMSAKACHISSSPLTSNQTRNLTSLCSSIQESSCTQCVGLGSGW